MPSQLPPDHEADRPVPLPWQLENIAFDKIELDRIRPREDMLYMLAAASFVEIASDTYAGNLAEYFRDDAEIADWLSTHWEQEEMQHGRALRAYIEHVWPEFDWQDTYRPFLAEYSLTCGSEGYEPTRALEMVARCVVEMGTSTIYSAIRDMADEPVLRQLTEHIRSDEVRHYKNFLRFFDRYNAREKNGRRKVFSALKRRLVEARHSDAEIGLWHAFHAMHPDQARTGERFLAMQSRVARMVRQHYPADQAFKMLLKPLRLPAFFAAIIQPLVQPLALVVRQLLLR